MTTHNSYRWSLNEQLDNGVRGLELDIHDSWTLKERFQRIFTLLRIVSGKGTFKVGHLNPGDLVKHIEGGNPDNNDLDDWLRVINNWSEKNSDHAPITIFLDIKKDLRDWNNKPHHSYGLFRLDEQIINAFQITNESEEKTRIYEFKMFKQQFSKKNTTEISWPTIGQLRGKIILVLMSFHMWPGSILDFWGGPFMYTRLAYVKGQVGNVSLKQYCFTAYNPDDRKEPKFDPVLESQGFFVTAYPPEDFSSYWNQNKIVRTDYKPKSGSWPALPPHVHFPATDHWKDVKYLNATNDWVI